jgi:hypothetical protein
MRVISAFPGCGKTTFIKDNPSVQDSDSSTFDKAEFPGNYLEYIQSSVAAGVPILVSTHQPVRSGLVDLKIPFGLVYPIRSTKEEYRQRYLNREGFNGGEAFADLITKFWDTWIDECENQKGCVKIVLGPGQFLADVVKVVEGEFYGLLNGNGGDWANLDWIREG